MKVVLYLGKVGTTLFLGAIICLVGIITEATLNNYTVPMQAGIFALFGVLSVYITGLICTIKNSRH